MPPLTEEMVKAAARVKNLEDVRKLNCWFLFFVVGLLDRGMEITDVRKILCFYLLFRSR